MYSDAFAQKVNYSCKDEFNQLNVALNYANKTINIEKLGTFKFWVENNLIFWQSANVPQVYEYTLKKSFNQLSAELLIKAHNLITSENKWYNYNCTINN